jgi:hypothetical protein
VGGTLAPLYIDDGTTIKRIFKGYEAFGQELTDPKQLHSMLSQS